MMSGMHFIIEPPKFSLYGIIILVALAVGALYIFALLKKEKLLQNNVYLYLLIYFISVFTFSKLFTVIVSKGEANIINAGLSSYGAMLGVFAASFIFESILDLDGKLIRYSVVSLPLIYGISKTGCFIAGCCCGLPYDGPFSVIYPDGENIPLIPVQLIETVCFLLIFFILNAFSTKRYIVYITVISCALLKFLLDYLRNDHLTKSITVNQIFSIVLVGVTLIWLFMKKIKQEIGDKE